MKGRHDGLPETSDHYYTFESLETLVIITGFTLLEVLLQVSINNARDKLLVTNATHALEKESNSI